jgi:hypothetical protein
LVTELGDHQNFQAQVLNVKLQGASLCKAHIVYIALQPASSAAHFKYVLCMLAGHAVARDAEHAEQQLTPACCSQDKSAPQVS